MHRDRRSAFARWTAVALLTFVLASPRLGASEAPATAPAAAPSRQHTLELAAGAARPPATIADVAWIAGHWRGDGLGGLNEEIWSPPLFGRMIGMYRLVKDGQLAFHELLTLMEDAGSLTLRLKHFDADLKGWEEKEEVREFKLVKLTADAAWFAGLTFRRLDAEHAEVWVAIHHRDGSVAEECFAYQRVQPPLAVP